MLARHAPPREVLAVVAEGVIAVFAESTQGTARNLGRRCLRRVLDHENDATISEARQSGLANRRCVLVLREARVVDHLTATQVDTVVPVKSTPDADVGTTGYHGRAAGR
jgi:hypothetical protein